MNSNVRQDFAIDMLDNKPKLWSMHYINTLTVSLIIGISNIILITVLPLVIVSIGGNNSIAGLLTTILAISSLVFRPFFGKMLDNTGRRIVLILGLCLFSLSTILLVASTNMLLMFVLRFFQGIGLSAYSTALGTILSDVVPAKRISEGVGYFGISQNIAMAIGPTLGMYFCNRFGYQITYVITFVISLSSIVFAGMIHYEEKRENRSDKAKENIAIGCEMDGMSQNQVGKGFIEISSVRPCIVLLFIIFAISPVFLFMPIFGKARDIDNIGLYFTFYAVSMILTRLVTGKVADRFGYLKVFVPGIAIIFIVFLTLAFAYSLPSVLLAAVLFGVGYGTVQPGMNAIIITLSPPERRGAANATYYATSDIGFGIGSFVWGVVSQFAGFTVVFLNCAFCIALSALAYYLILHPSLEKNG